MKPGPLPIALLRFALIALAIALVSGPLAPLADAGPRAWTFAWRPNWLPGDPWNEPTAASWLFAGATPGLMIAIDPETKKPVTPTAEQRRAWTEAMERGGPLGAPVAPDAPLRVEKLPGGGEVMYLDGRFQVYVVARRDANGRVVTDCASDDDAARRLMAQPVPAAKPLREER